MSRHALTVFALVVLQELPALAQSASDAATASDAAAASDAVGLGGSATNGGMWEWFNSFLIGIEDTILSLFPSTPPHFKLSFLLEQLHTAFPAAPWYLASQFLGFFLFVAGALVILKAIKLFWI